jgi:hypothetical protein
VKLARRDHSWVRVKLKLGQLVTSTNPSLLPRFAPGVLRIDDLRLWIILASSIRTVVG